MNRALAALAARPLLRGLVIALAVSLETILLVEAVRQVSGTTFVASAALIAIAVVASFAGTRFGLLSAFLFIVYGAFIYAEGNQPPNFTSDGLFQFVVLCRNGDRTGPDRRLPQGPGGSEEGHRTRA